MHGETHGKTSVAFRSGTATFFLLFDRKGRRGVTMKFTSKRGIEMARKLYEAEENY